MASASTETASSSRHWKYDVFLSFHGKDTRWGFTSHLYDGLKQEGIIGFRDDRKLKRGEFINSGLLKAIEESKYAVVVLSKNYASSRWCLMELAKIVQCSKAMDLEILPVFYHVDPSKVRNQAGTFAIAFFKHTIDPRTAIKDVRSWKAAFRQVGKIAGWHIHERYESTVVKNIIQRIHEDRSIQLQSDPNDIQLQSDPNDIQLQSDPNDLVGKESQVMGLEVLLDIGLDDVRFIGISGKGGIGKTTLAQIIYNRFYSKFEASSFISCVREETERHGLVYLQRKLLSDILMDREIINTWDDGRVINEMESRLSKRRVFIILDDVNENKQLEALARRHSWFGKGSRVVVTSREKQVLNSHGVHITIYPVKELGDDEALQLFCQKAFKKSHPEYSYVDLSKDLVNYAKGLPGSLKVLGYFLYDKRIDDWKRIRDQLKENPDRDVLEMHDLLRKMDQESVLHDQIGNFPPAPMNTHRVSSSSSSSSPPVLRWKYDVFISFHGWDTRRGFTGHLYAALKQKGIIAFRDDEKLERGELISSGLLKAIEESEYAVIILSPNFASSRWCLIELAKIVQCRKDMGLVVLPVFYHVNPSDVRKQSGTFAEALAIHEQNSRIVKEDVQTWRAALREVGEISGCHIQTGSDESMLVESIVARILYRLRNTQGTPS